MVMQKERAEEEMIYTPTQNKNGEFRCTQELEELPAWFKSTVWESLGF